MWEILVPCKFEDTQKPVRTKHHRKWDEYVRTISGGLTILMPAKGQWIHKERLYTDRVIPVRVICTQSEIEKIIDFTITHYRQIAVLAYRISDKVILKHAADIRN